jgi:hypothetical protein
MQLDTPVSGGLSTVTALALCAGSDPPVLFGDCGRGGQRERAALGVTYGPLIAGMDDRSAEFADTLDIVDPRRRLSVSACHPDPAAAGRGERATPRTPCQNRSARSGSSAGNSMSGAGIDASMDGGSCSRLLCATTGVGASAEALPPCAICGSDGGVPGRVPELL